MKKILIAYGTVGIGGSTTSLLSLLENINYEVYEIDLILSENKGELINLIPDEVNILEQAWPQKLSTIKRKSLKSILRKIISVIIARMFDSPIISKQLMSYDNVRYSRKLEKEYDVAISYLENFPLNYIVQNVKAKKKISWIHVDYIEAGFLALFDKKTFKKLDKIILVSQECKASFEKKFPELRKNLITIENMLSEEVIKVRADEKYEKLNIDKEFLNLISVCRITFSHKGLDRGVTSICKLVNLGYKIHWYIIGDGIDKEKMEKLIFENSMENNIFLLGKRTNPFPLLNIMDLFFLPSRYEGKPMAVTEAQLLGIPPVVTEYSSAREQVKSKIDGLVMGNDDEGIYMGLKYIVDNIDVIKIWKKNLKRENYTNIDEMKKIYEVIEEK